MDNLPKMLDKLGWEIINSPFLSVMIVNKKYQIVWHNRRFAEEFNGGGKIDRIPCFQAIGSEKAHEDCPLQRSLRGGIHIKGFLDFGEKNFLFFTIPLDEEHAAKVHVFLSKEPDGMADQNA